MFPSAGGGFGVRGRHLDGSSYGKDGSLARADHVGKVVGFGDFGSAARFFYSAKADSDDRIKSKHPTVKPVDLMCWLVRLVTPKGGLVLDPFAGTGTTAEAALAEGMRCVLVENESEYQDDIRRRMRTYGHGPNHRIYELAKGDKIELGPLFQFAGMEA